MSLWKRLTGNFVHQVAWSDDDGRTLVTRFDSGGQRIPYGTRLIVQEGQAAVFVHNGQLADVFGPGVHALVPSALPVLESTRPGLAGSSDSVHAEVWFCSTKQFTGLRWGTKNPIIKRDPEFDVVRLRAFGTFSVRITLPGRFLKEIVGTDSRFLLSELEEELRDLVVGRIGVVLAATDVSLVELAGHYDRIGHLLKTRVREDFQELGLSITDVLVENISIPAAVEAALDLRTGQQLQGTFNRKPTPAQIDPPLAESAPPPLLPRDLSLYIAESGVSVGPFAESAARELVTAGRLQRETFVWFRGLAEWRRAEDLPQLEALFAEQEPPPFPPMPR